jgi:hypothetical protein
MKVAKAAIEIAWIQWEDRNNIVHATHTIAESAQMDTTITIMLNQVLLHLTLAGQAMFNKLYTMSQEAHTTLPPQVKHQWIRCITQEHQSTNNVECQYTLLRNWLHTAAPTNNSTVNKGDNKTIKTDQTDMTAGTSHTATTAATSTATPPSAAP